jgi:CubicO group peptidase (beta-lactamase class C family)
MIRDRSRRPSRTALLLALVATVAPSSAIGQSLAPETAARVDAVFARFTATSPGCALDVRRGGASVYTKGYGLASLELGVPISPKTVFDIGSTSKQITAASVALLALDDKLSLDDDVRKFVPELPDLGAEVTLRHLLTHTGGWRDYIDVMSLAGFDDRDHTTEADALEALRRQRGLNFAPGSDFRYSNTGFFLMSLVVQRVSGRSLADFARERIFEPLGMHDTRFLTDSRAVIPNKATAYEPVGGGSWRVAMSNWEQIGDGAVQTTVGDLALWDANLTSGKVGGRALIDLLHTPARLNDGTTVPYGLGLFVDEYHRLGRVHHGGAWAGYRAMSMRFPSEGLSLLIACNVADAGTQQLAQAVADVLLSNPSSMVARTADAPRRASGGRVPRSGIFYDEGAGGLLRLKTSGDSLFVDGTTPIPLVPLGGERFRNSRSGTELRYEQDANGARRWFTGPSTSGGPIVYREVQPPVDSTRFTEYAGTYASTEAGAEWKIGTSGGALTLHPQRGEDAELRPLFRDAFGGGYVLRFERDQAGRIVALTVTTRGLHALRFARR